MIHRIRKELSEQSNQFTKKFIARNKVSTTINGKIHYISNSYKRFHLAYIESLLIKYLKYLVTKDENKPKPLQINFTIPPDLSLKESWIKLKIEKYMKRMNRFYFRFHNFFKRILFYFFAKLKPNANLSQIKRLFIVDAGELKWSKINGKKYLYHKYLEGILDFDKMDWGKDTLVLLYGQIETIGLRKVLHRNIMLHFNTNMDISAYIHILNLIDLSTPEEIVKKITLNDDHSKTDPTKLAIKKINKSINYLSDIIIQELKLNHKIENILSRVTGKIEILLDNYDSLLFTLTQFIRDNYDHDVTGIQKVLGPYYFSFDLTHINEDFKQPTKIMTWAPFHNKQLQDMKYTCTLESSCSFKIKKYNEYKGSVNLKKVKKILKVPEGKRIIMFSAVRTVVGFDLIHKSRYFKMMQDLAQLALETNSFILFKPWPGEDFTTIKYFLKLFFSTKEHKNTFILADDKIQRKLHNVELLQAADILISTMSSFIGEAFFFDTTPILVNYRSCENYFTEEYTNKFKDFCYVHDESNPLLPIIHSITDQSPKERSAYFTNMRPGFEQIFGNPS